MTTILELEFTLPLATQHRWPSFWENLQLLLRESGYQRETRRVYRSVLRRFARYARVKPCEIKRSHINDYLHMLGRSRCSAQWLAMNISILRTIFDKCCDQTLLHNKSCPLRPWKLPSILSEKEVGQLLRATQCPRDALLLSFLYGCGLRPGEAVRLRWGDLDLQNGTVRVHQREIRYPQAMSSVLLAGVSTFSASDWIFPGSGLHGHLTTRSLTRILRRAAIESGILRPVTAMTLRHSYAVHQLQQGANIREVQDLLGHHHLITTMKYLYLKPAEITSPADQLSSILPTLPAEAATAPYTDDRDQNRNWFLGWFKSRLLGWLQRPPDSG